MEDRKDLAESLRRDAEFIQGSFPGIAGNMRAAAEALTRPEEAKATEILRELVAAGDYTVSGEDDVAAMLRFGKANDVARAFLACVPQEQEGK